MGFWVQVEASFRFNPYKHEHIRCGLNYVLDDIFGKQFPIDDFEAERAWQEEENGERYAPHGEGGPMSRSITIASEVYDNWKESVIVNFYGSISDCMVDDGTIREWFSESCSRIESFTKLEFAVCRASDWEAELYVRDDGETRTYEL